MAGNINIDDVFRYFDEHWATYPDLLPIGHCLCGAEVYIQKQQLPGTLLLSCAAGREHTWTSIVNGLTPRLARINPTKPKTTKKGFFSALERYYHLRIAAGAGAVVLRANMIAPPGDVQDDEEDDNGQAQLQPLVLADIDISEVIPAADRDAASESWIRTRLNDLLYAAQHPLELLAHGINATYFMLALVRGDLPAAMAYFQPLLERFAFQRHPDIAALGRMSSVLQEEHSKEQLRKIQEMVESRVHEALRAGKKDGSC